MTKLQRRLGVCASFSMLLALISLLPFGREKNALHSFETALLNPSYGPGVGQISITHENSHISLRKNPGELWTASDGENTILADAKMIENLILASTKVQRVYEISRSEKYWKSAGLTEENQYSLIFLDRFSPRVYTKVYFGDTTELIARRYLRTDMTKSVYEIADSFSPFLNTSLAFWAEGELLSVAKEPVAYVFRTPYAVKKITSGRPDFAQISHTLKSIRHGLLSAKPDYEPEATLSCEDASGRFIILSFYKDEKEGNEGSYLCATSIIPSYKDNLETQEFLKSVSFTYEMSAFTFQKVKALFVK